jgi:hypothetical protein
MHFHPRNSVICFATGSEGEGLGGALYIFGKLEGVVIMWAHLPKHPFLCDLCVPFQGLIYW